MVPHCQYLVEFYAYGFMIGFGSGAWDCGQTVWFVEMWQKKSGPILQFSQFAFGIGAIIGPLIDRPFIIGEVNGTHKYNALTSINNTVTPNNHTVIPNNNTETPDYNNTVTHNNYNTVTPEDRQKSLFIPFAIDGFIQLCGAIMMTIMFFINRYQTPIQLKQPSDSFLNEKIMDDNKSDDNKNDEDRIVIKYQRFDNIKLTEENGSPTKLIIALGALCLASYTAVENCHFQFSPTFNQYIPLRLSAPEAAEILSAMTTCFTVARGISIFIAIKIKPQRILAYHFCIIFIASNILLFAENCLTLIWVANILIGEFIAFNSQ